MAADLAWSPDGSLIAIASQDGLSKLPAHGGGSPEKFSIATSNRGMIWVGDSIFGLKNSTLIRIPLHGGTPREIGTIPGSPALYAAGEGGKTAYLQTHPSEGQRMLEVSLEDGKILREVELDLPGISGGMAVNPADRGIAAVSRNVNFDLYLLEGFPQPTTGLERLFRKWRED